MSLHTSAVETAPFGHLIFVNKYYDRALFSLGNDEVKAERDFRSHTERVYEGDHGGKIIMRPIQQSYCISSGWKEEWLQFNIILQKLFGNLRHFGMHNILYTVESTAKD
jgi:hypothetical protein